MGEEEKKGGKLRVRGTASMERFGNEQVGRGEKINLLWEHHIGRSRRNNTQKEEKQ